MESLGLIVGHLLGDYILQNDWQAKNKANPFAGHYPGRWLSDEGGGAYYPDSQEAADAWQSKRVARNFGHVACLVHCLLYTLAVWACSFWWMPWWGLALCFAAHFPIDRFRLARLWMIHVAGQKDFATGPLSPWSIIVVDNTFHLLTLFLIGLAARP